MDLFETLKDFQGAYNKGLITGAEIEKLEKEKESERIQNEELVQSPKDEDDFYNDN